MRIRVHASRVRTRLHTRTRGDETQRYTYIELRHPRNCLHTVGSGHRYVSYLTCIGCLEITKWLEGIYNLDCKVATCYDNY